MIDPQVLNKLVNKSFPMVGPTPTYQELMQALIPNEHNIYCSPEGTHRGYIVKNAPNKKVTTTMEDSAEDNLMARLWLEVNQ